MSAKGMTQEQIDADLARAGRLIVQADEASYDGHHHRAWSLRVQADHIRRRAKTEQRRLTRHSDPGPGLLRMRMVESGNFFPREG